MTDTWQPPATRRDDTVEVMHGVEVADPYRWLEAIDSPEVAAWVAEQNSATVTWMAPLAGKRREIRDRLDDVAAVTLWGPARRRGERWFATRRDPHADQPVLVVADDPSDIGKVLIDPAAWSGEGEPVTATIAAWAPSPDGSLVAYARSDSGSDWMTWRVRDVASGEDLPDEVRWSKFCEAAWLASGDGFFYAGLDAPAADDDPTAVVVETPRITLHRLGRPQADDTVLHRESDPELLPDAEVSDDGRWLILTVTRGTLAHSVIRVVDLADPGALPRDLVPEPTAMHRVAGVIGSTFYLHTDDIAARGRVIALDAADASATRREVVAESDDQIEAVALAGDALVLQVLRDASSGLRVHDLDGRLRHDVALPPASAITGLHTSAGSPLVALTLTSFADPGSAWLLDTTSGTLSRLHDSGGEPPRFAIDRVAATSADGTRVPMWLVHRPDVTPTGEVPTLLYGYGGFDIPITPIWKPDWQVWVERGNLLAVANLRGGGEFGREWYDAGRRERKQNVFDDALGCARWLAASEWTRAERIAITGRSNGGLLAAACLTQAPDCFGAAVPEVGVLDVFRFHRFSIGWAWASDFGSPEVETDWQWIRTWSPLHRIEPGRHYPPTLVTTGDHDDRVMPAHSYKFAAALQHAQGGSAPILLRIDTAAGHGAGKPVSKLLDERADVLAFLTATLCR